MKAAWYETQGPAEEVLVIGEMPDPTPAPGEVRIKVCASGINPGDVKKRSDAYGLGMPFRRVIPHSDGSGVIDSVGAGVSASRVGERVWCFGAQSYRPFGTAAEYVVVPEANLGRLPDTADFAQGACLGIPGITGHRAVHVGGPVNGRTLLVQGGAGSVGLAAVALGRQAGARVLATVRRAADEAIVRDAGADAVLRTDGASQDDVVSMIRDAAPDGVDHIVEVAFHANLVTDERVLRNGGSIATYATEDPTPTVPFWPLIFKNARLFFLGSDDFGRAEKQRAAADIAGLLENEWDGYRIAHRFPLADVARAHVAVEERRERGRVVLALLAGTV